MGYFASGPLEMVFAVKPHVCLGFSPIKWPKDSLSEWSQFNGLLQLLKSPLSSGFSAYRHIDTRFNRKGPRDAPGRSPERRRRTRSAFGVLFPRGADLDRSGDGSVSFDEPLGRRRRTVRWRWVVFGRRWTVLGSL